MSWYVQYGYVDAGLDYGEKCTARQYGEKSAGVAAWRAELSAGTRSGNMGRECTPI